VDEATERQGSLQRGVRADDDTGYPRILGRDVDMDDETRTHKAKEVQVCGNLGFPLARHLAPLTCAASSAASLCTTPSFNSLISAEESPRAPGTS